jgi:hypothetical protein
MSHQPVSPETAKAFLAAFNAHDLDAIMEFFADDCSEWSLTGTTPAGVAIKVRGGDHDEFRDGKVIRKDAYWKIVEKPR